MAPRSASNCAWCHVGTPVPLLPAAGSNFTELAVAAMPFPTYSQTWALLGEEGAALTPVGRHALRHLTAAARCALTALPAGKENDAKAAQLVQDLKAAVDVMLNPETQEQRSKRKAAAEACSLPFELMTALRCITLCCHVERRIAYWLVCMLP